MSFVDGPQRMELVEGARQIDGRKEITLGITQAERRFSKFDGTLYRCQSFIPPWFSHDPIPPPARAFKRRQARYARGFTIAVV